MSEEEVRGEDLVAKTIGDDTTVLFEFKEGRPRIHAISSALEGPEDNYEWRAFLNSNSGEFTVSDVLDELKSYALGFAAVNPHYGPVCMIGYTLARTAWELAKPVRNPFSLDGLKGVGFFDNKFLNIVEDSFNDFLKFYKKDHDAFEAADKIVCDLEKVIDQSLISAEVREHRFDISDALRFFKMLNLHIKLPFDPRHVYDIRSVVEAIEHYEKTFDAVSLRKVLADIAKPVIDFIYDDFTSKKGSSRLRCITSTVDERRIFLSEALRAFSIYAFKKSPEGQLKEIDVIKDKVDAFIDGEDYISFKKVKRVFAYLNEFLLNPNNIKYLL